METHLAEYEETVQNFAWKSHAEEQAQTSLERQ